MDLVNFCQLLFSNGRSHLRVTQKLLVPTFFNVDFILFLQEIAEIKKAYEIGRINSPDKFIITFIFLLICNGCIL